MYTSVILALAGFLSAPAAPSPKPTWSNDYFSAQERGQKERKPLAVFVGSGQRERKLSEAAERVLGSQYICVYLDTSRPQARNLADSLAITKSRGLVISDRTGQLQAFHHDGDLNDQDLLRNLQRFAAADVEVRTTISNVPERVSFYPPSNGSVRISVGRSC